MRSTVSQPACRAIRRTRDHGSVNREPTTDEIVRLLTISLTTAKTHLSRTRVELGVGDRVAVSGQNGLARARPDAPAG